MGCGVTGWGVVWGVGKEGVRVASGFGVWGGRARPLQSIEADLIYSAEPRRANYKLQQITTNQERPRASPFL
jgi:hypothetical protein